MKVMNGLDLQSQKAINVADPSAGTDAANKQYVDNVINGLKWKSPVRAASTTNINLASPGATIDGVSMVAGDRFLAKDQTTASQNGLYVWNGAAVAATRSTDADGAGEVGPNTTVYVNEGTTNADKAFTVSTDGPIVIGTTSIAFAQTGGGQTYTAGNGINIASNVISAAAAASGGIAVGAGGISVDATIVARKFSANIGNGSLTSIAVTHNLGTKDVMVSVRDAATDAGVLVDWVATDTNTVTLTFAVAPAANAYRATIIG